MTSGPLTTTLTNTGTVATGPLSISNSVGDVGDFFGPAGPSTCLTVAVGGLPAGASCTFGFTFTPTTTGPRTRSLTFSATPGGSATLTLVGIGIPAPQAILTLTPALGWPVWVPATVALAIAIPWAGTPHRRHLLPWISLVIVLAAVVAEDLSSSWHRVYWQSRPVWGAGMLSILLVALLPLATILLFRPLATRRIGSLRGRIALLAAAGLLVRLVVGAHLYRWIQRGLLG